MPNLSLIPLAVPDKTYYDRHRDRQMSDPIKVPNEPKYGMDMSYLYRVSSDFREMRKFREVLI